MSGASDSFAMRAHRRLCRSARSRPISDVRCLLARKHNARWGSTAHPETCLVSLASDGPLNPVVLRGRVSAFLARPLREAVANGVGGGGRAGGEVQFGEQVRDVVIDGAGTDGECVRDLAVGESLREQTQNLDFA